MCVSLSRSLPYFVNAHLPPRVPHSLPFFSHSPANHNLPTALSTHTHTHGYNTHTHTNAHSFLIYFEWQLAFDGLSADGARQRERGGNAKGENEMSKNDRMQPVCVRTISMHIYIYTNTHTFHSTQTKKMGETKLCLTFCTTAIEL